MNAENEIRKALWFSRHTPTSHQFADARRTAEGYELTVTDHATRLANIDINDEATLKAVTTGLIAECVEQGATAIAGVFPVPMQLQMARSILGAWNVKRTREGERSTFRHKQFCLIGYLNRDSLRWL